MEPLQSFDVGSSTYERPTQRWVCGHAAEGHPCHAGPDGRGRCGATAECKPARNHERWECTRSPQAGGQCPSGPLPDGTCCRPIAPCSPVRNIRARRGRTAAMLVVIVVGLLAVFAGGARSRWLIEPGPLALKHAAIANCDACHGKIGNGPVAWLHAAMTSVDPSEAAGRCLTCHSLGEHALATHGRPPAELAAATERIHAEALRMKAVFGVITPAATMPRDRAMPELTCTACHQEHRGTQANLRTIGDAVCQTCHLEQFASLANGHPEFKSYPYHRRTRMIFDHGAHYRTHFAKSDPAVVPSECTSCHVIGPVGRVMTVRGFEANCAACHADQIRGKSITGDKGIAVFTIPGLDLDSLRGHGVEIGQWPEAADGEMSPFIRLLLAADPATGDDLETLGDTHLADLRKANDGQIAAAGRIAWAVKGLLFDLTTAGPSGLQGRVQNGLASDTARMNVADLMSGLPQDTVLAAQSAWFPDLAKEVALHRSGKALPPPVSPTPAAASGSDTKAPTASAAAASHDDILGGGILGGADDTKKPDAKDAPPAAAASHDDILGGGILGDAKGAASPLSPGNDNKADILGDSGGGLLAAAAPPADKNTNQPPSGGASDILPGGDILGGAMATQPLAAPSAATAPAASETKQPKPVEGEEWATLGGWYRQDFALFYRPTQHADRFMRAWLDTTAAQALDPEKKAAMRVFDTLADPAGPGNCVKCHSVDQSSEGLKVNWRSRQPDPDARHTTNFSHTAHFSLFKNNGCETCHVGAEGADVLSTYKGRDPSIMITAFRPIPRAFCAACHVTDRAAETCTTCHSYHVGQVPLAKGVSTMQRDQ